MLLAAEHISKNFGMKQLLDNISIYLEEKDRVGIVGVNGTGKSTLLKILAGEEPADSGVISSNPNLKTAYLSQNPIMSEKLTAIEQVLGEFSAEFRAENGFEAKSMLTRLGVDCDAQVSTLSGGQRKRVALASVLIRPSDILILDEPTNHLDSEMVSWLEQYLARYSGGIIMVTHDRYFLEHLARHIVELSRGNIFSYEANYSRYLELKSELAEMDNASERKRQSVLRREAEWIMRGAKARSTKSRDRIQRYEDLKDKAAPVEDNAVQMSTVASRLGRKIIELNAISKTFGENKVVSDFSYTLLRDDRIGIVGRNGAGKSTLLNIIAGQITPDTGEIDTGTTVKIGYFMQECGELDFGQRAYDFITNIAREIKTDDGTLSASQMMERFLFTPEQQFTEIGRLSGGERRRLYLLGILMATPNILLLDEPTNDLDIETLTILEDYLQTFPGAVISVSHDRYFLDKIANGIFEVGEGGEITNYTGNYSDYISKREPQASIDLSTKKPIEKACNAEKEAPRQKPKRAKFTFKEQREFITIDNEIAELEEKIRDCTAQIAGTASDYVRLQELMAQNSQLKAELEDKTERWVYLNELDELINSKE